MTLRSDAKLKGKLTFGFKYDIRNLRDFHPVIRFELKKYRRVIYLS